MYMYYIHNLIGYILYQDNSQSDKFDNEKWEEWDEDGDDHEEYGGGGNGDGGYGGDGYGGGGYGGGGWGPCADKKPFLTCQWLKWNQKCDHEHYLDWCQKTCGTCEIVSIDVFYIIQVTALKYNKVI